MKHIMAKFVPLLLLAEQKNRHATVANDLIQTITNEPEFLKKFILEMYRVSTAVIQKQRPHHPNGSRLVLHA